MGVKIKFFKVIVCILILLITTLSVSALFGRVTIDGPQYHICYKLNGKTYNYIVDAYELYNNIPIGWVCPDSEINITEYSIKIKCGSLRFGSARNGIWNGCDGGKTCRMHAFYTDHYTSIYSDASGEEPSWDYGGLIDIQNDYAYHRFISFMWQVTNKPITHERVEFGTNPCPPAFIYSISPENGSTLTSKINTVTFTTDIDAVCLYSNVSGADMIDMMIINDTDIRTHSFSFEGNDSTNYSFYIKCIDEFEDVNEGNYILTYFVDFPQSGGGGGGGGVPANISNLSIISFFPSNLTLSITEPNNQIFNITALNQDNDTIINWYQNGSFKSSSNSFIFLGNFTSEGLYNLTVIVSSRNVTKYMNWNLTVVNSNPSGHIILNNISDFGLDVDNDGLYDFLVISINVSVPYADTYQFDGRLSDNKNNFYEPFNSVDVNLVSGYNSLNLNFSGIPFYKNGINGPYGLSRFYVEHPSFNIRFIQPDFYKPFYNTSDYSYLEFERSFAKIIGVTKDYGYDSDNDSLYNDLIFEVDVNVTKSKEFEIMYLVTYPNQQIYNFRRKLSLPQGLNTVNLTLSGTDINTKQIHGNFIIEEITINILHHNVIDRLSDDYVTSVYDYNDFQSFINFTTIESTIRTFAYYNKSFYIVVGVTGHALDAISASNIAAGLQYNITGNCHSNATYCVINPAKLDNEIDDNPTSNLILIGRPQNNRITNLYLPSTIWPLTLNRAIIKLIKNNSTAKLILTGSNDWDTRKASEVIAEYSKYNLNSDCVELDTKNNILLNCNLSKYPDFDMDKDTIENARDYIVGNGSNLISNINNLNILINGSQNISKFIEGQQKVNFLKGNYSILEFVFNFSNSSKLDLTNISIINSSNSTESSLIVYGISLPIGVTKTVYLEKIDNEINGICVKDEEIVHIGEISANCDGNNEFKIECDGTDQNGYSCTYNSSSNLYRITGLKHSGVMQFSYIKTFPPPSNSNSGGGSSSGGGGSGGGGGGGVAGFVCNMDWKCSEWSECINRIQTRTCEFVRVPQHVQNEACPEQSKPPTSTQNCIAETPAPITALATSAGTNAAQPESEQKTNVTAVEQPPAETGLNAITGAVTRVLTNPKAVRDLLISTVVLAIIISGIFWYNLVYKKK